MSLRAIYKRDMAHLANVRNMVMHGRNGDHRALADAVDALVDHSERQLTAVVPEAPMLPNGLPAYVIEGEWHNSQPVDPVEGSLLHPYNVRSVFTLVLPDGRHMAFPYQSSAMNWAITHPEITVIPLPPAV